MDIVQDLRREILADTQGESVFVARPYLRNFSFEELKKKGNQDQELVDMMIKTFAYWKVVKKRLIDWVLLSCRCNLVTELLDQKLKPALITATESAGSLCSLMAPDDALARERNDVAKRLDALDEAHRLLETAPSLGISLDELARRARLTSGKDKKRRKLSLEPPAAGAKAPAAAAPVVAEVSAPAPAALAAATVPVTPTTALGAKSASGQPNGLAPTPVPFGGAAAVGAAPAPPSFEAAPASSVPAFSFGGAAVAAPALAPAPAFAFGSSAAASAPPAPATKPPSPFGAPAAPPGSLFGAPAPPGFGGFGAPAAPKP